MDIEVIQHEHGRGSWIPGSPWLASVGELVSSRPRGDRVSKTKIGTSRGILHHSRPVLGVYAYTSLHMNLCTHTKQTSYKF